MNRPITPRDFYNIVRELKRLTKLLDRIEFKVEMPKNIYFKLEGKADDIFKGSKKKSKMVKGPHHGRGDGST